MFHIAWLQLLYFATPALFALLIYWMRRRSRPGWTKEVAGQLGGKVKGPGLVEGITAGLPWEVTLNLGVSSESRPSWRVSFPTVSCTELVVRAETKRDATWKKRGFIEELSVGDEAFDARHLLLCAQPEAAGALLRHEPLRAALRALPLEESRQAEGRILWVQAGQGLEASIDVSAIPDTVFADRLAELFHQLVALAQVLREAPRRGTPGLWHRRVADTQAEWGWLIIVLWALVPVAFSLLGVLMAVTGTVKMPLGFLLAMLVGFGTAGVLVVPYLLWLRRSPLFHRHILRIPALLILGGLLGPLVLVEGNALASGPVEEREVKVLNSWPDDDGVLDFWLLDLDGIGKTRVDWEAGNGVRQGDTVRVRMTTGALGSPRILSWAPVAHTP